jgi:hypothetical protein|tara:strand:- start:217 stop:417 length:201 start_codon:yes stop_codon:yes gene_type:complete
VATPAGCIWLNVHHLRRHLFHHLLSRRVLLHHPRQLEPLPKPINSELAQQRADRTRLAQRCELLDA